MKNFLRDLSHQLIIFVFAFAAAHLTRWGLTHATYNEMVLFWPSVAAGMLFSSIAAVIIILCCGASIKKRIEGNEKAITIANNVGKAFIIAPSLATLSLGMLGSFWMALGVATVIAFGFSIGIILELYRIENKRKSQMYV